jgi:hypothetical protein
MVKLRFVLFVLLSVLLLASCVVAPPISPLPTPAPRVLPTQSHRVYLPFSNYTDHFGKGAAMTDSIANGCEDALYVGAHWAQNWSPSWQQCWGITYLAMQQGRDSGVGCPVLQDAPITLMLNEPEWYDPPLDVYDAARMIHRWTVECYPNRRWASPAGISTDTADGLAYTARVWDAYYELYGEAPRFDVAAHHCYSWSTGDVCIQRTQAVIDWAKAHGIRGVLITEFAVLPCATSPEVAIRENDKYVEWMKHNPDVLGWAFFATRYFGTEGWAFKPADRCLTTLMDAVTGEPTKFGEWYKASGDK